LVGLELIMVLYCTWRLLEKVGIGVGPRRGASLDDPDYGSDNHGLKTDLKWYVGIFVAGLAGLYTHVIFAFMLAFLSLAFVYYNLKISPRKIVYWIITLGAMGLAYTPEVIRWTERAGSRQHIIVEANARAIKASIIVMLKSLSQFMFGFYYRTFKDNPLQFPKILAFLAAIALIAGLIWVAIVLLKRKSFTAPEQRPAASLMGAFLLFNFCLFLVLEVSSSRHMIPFFIPLSLLLGLMLSRLQVLWRSIFLGLLGLFTVLSLATYYRAPYFAYEEADWRALSRYLKIHAGPQDVMFCEAGRNALYTILYYVPDPPWQVKYLNTKNWPADPYQLDYRREYADQPSLLYQNLANNYKRVWVVSLRGFFDGFAQQDQYKPIVSEKFGPELSLYAF
jgi:hypothetical protein